jgi:hypothetical protein
MQFWNFAWAPNSHKYKDSKQIGADDLNMERGPPSAPAKIYTREPSFSKAGLIKMNWRLLAKYWQEMCLTAVTRIFLTLMLT